eukprot:g68448.t1
MGHFLVHTYTQRTHARHAGCLVSKSSHLFPWMTFFVFICLSPSTFSAPLDLALYEATQWKFWRGLGKCLPSSCNCPCSNGPYYYEEYFKTPPEGIGSFLQCIRTGAVLDHLKIAKWIVRAGSVESTPWHVNLNNTVAEWWMDFLGFRYRGNDCNECSMYRQLRANKLNAIENASIHGVRTCVDAKLASKNLPYLRPTDVIYISKQRAIPVFESPQCTVHWFESLYSQQWNADIEHLKEGRRPLVSGRVLLPSWFGNHTTIGIHFRAGDALVPGREGLGDISNHDLTNFVKTLAAAFDPSKVFMFAVCECEKNYLDFLVQAAHPLKMVVFNGSFWTNGDVEGPILHLDLLAHADILVLGSSSFAVLAATLNPTASFLVSSRRKYQNWGRATNKFYYSAGSLLSVTSMVFEILRSTLLIVQPAGPIPSWMSRHLFTFGAVPVDLNKAMQVIQNHVN